MNIIWLGHSSFRIEIEDQVLLDRIWQRGHGQARTRGGNSGECCAFLVLPVR